jgi:hypothetical protein
VNQDFDVVFLKSRSQYSFSVYNGNNKPIHVEIFYEYESDLNETNPRAQIIPAYTSASFEIV